MIPWSYQLLFSYNRQEFFPSCQFQFIIYCPVVYFRFEQTFWNRASLDSCKLGFVMRLLRPVRFGESTAVWFPRGWVGVPPRNPDVPWGRNVGWVNYWVQDVHSAPERYFSIIVCFGFILFTWLVSFCLARSCLLFVRLFVWCNSLYSSHPRFGVAQKRFPPEAVFLAGRGNFPRSSASCM